MKAWHFLGKDGRLGYKDGREPVDGEWLEVDGEIYGCWTTANGDANGLHASRRLIDALRYAPGPIACRVEVEGDIQTDSDKLVARRRRILWRVDATEILHEFACRCAEDALALLDDHDPRSVAAIKAKRAWLRGEIDDKGLAAAGDAAWDTTWDIARATAMAAACAAARVTARVTARATARDVAKYAARATAKETQNRRLTAMISARKP